jgi:putative colanic acid biosynthesis UDP-glucose lipid carrier transferase
MGGSRKGRPFIQKYESGDLWLLMSLDILINVGLLFLLTQWRAPNFDSQYQVLLIMGVTASPYLYNLVGVYDKPIDAVTLFNRLARGLGMLIVALTVLAFLTKTSEYYSRLLIVSWFSLTFIFQFFSHLLVTRFFKRFIWKGEWSEPTLLVGASKVARYLATHVNNDDWLPIRFVGVIDDDEEALAKWDVDQTPIYRGIDLIPQLIIEKKIRRVMFALPLSDSAKVEKLYIDLLASNIDISWAPDIFGMPLVNPNIKEIYGVPVLGLSETPLIGARAHAKRLFDVVLASITLLMVSPIMAATALAIKFTSPGPIFFKQARHGWNGEEIYVWKFRSMRLHDEEKGVVTQATENDPRVTKVGRFIRKTSIDELPQLFNVLNGTMSMVGPRPHAVEHNNYYSELIHSYFARHRIKPGITGLAQVKGFRGQTKTLDKMIKRVEFDLEYINNWSLSLDIKILLQTVFVVISKDAY